MLYVSISTHKQRTMQVPVVRLNELCQGWSEISLLAVPQGVPVSLEAFCSLQAEAQALALARLSTLGDGACAQILSVCRASAVELAGRLTAFYCKQARYPSLRKNSTGSRYLSVLWY